MYYGNPDINRLITFDGRISEDTRDSLNIAREFTYTYVVRTRGHTTFWSTIRGPLIITPWFIHHSASWGLTLENEILEL